MTDAIRPRRLGDQIFVATETFCCQLRDERGRLQTYNVRKDQTRVRAGHPLLQANPQYFEPASEGVQFDVEQMTAAPGEKRGQH